MRAGLAAIPGRRSGPVSGCSPSWPKAPFVQCSPGLRQPGAPATPRFQAQSGIQSRRPWQVARCSRLGSEAWKPSQQGTRPGEALEEPARNRRSPPEQESPALAAGGSRQPAGALRLAAPIAGWLVIRRSLWCGVSAAASADCSSAAEPGHQDARAVRRAAELVGCGRPRPAGLWLACRANAQASEGSSRGCVPELECRVSE